MRPFHPASVLVLPVRGLPAVRAAVVLFAPLLLISCGDEPARPDLSLPRTAVLDVAENGRSIGAEDRTDATDGTLVDLIGRLVSVDRVLDVLFLRMEAGSASLRCSPPSAAVDRARQIRICDCEG
jgi:hypothetical protein